MILLISKVLHPSKIEIFHVQNIVTLDFIIYCAHHQMWFVNFSKVHRMDELKIFMMRY